ncbi:MAG: T9SS type A sorting domain-containing protein [Saprospiraceae bacterium]|nr:T9SS type A sorting domain-containing protein [Saprospiraceae bacterium]
MFLNPIQLTFRLFFLIVIANFKLAAQVLDVEILCTLPDEVKESSGLISLYNGISFWTHNDSGGEPILFEINQNCEILRSVRITNAENVDWEEICMDSLKNIYIGDFGNNSNDRKNLVIYKISGLDRADSSEIKAEQIHFEYSNQFAFPPSGQFLNFDMEAFVWINDSLHLFSKNRTNPFSGYCYQHTIPDQPGFYKSHLVDSFYTGNGLMQQFWVTGAAISPDHGKLILLSYDKAWLFYPLKPDRIFNSPVRELGFPYLSQKEGLSFTSESEIVISDEYFSLLRNGGTLMRTSLDKVLQSNDIESDHKYSIFPNPGSEIAQIFPTDYQFVTFYDLLGRPICTFDPTNTISLSNLIQGFYLVSVISDHKINKIGFYKK